MHLVSSHLLANTVRRNIGNDISCKSISKYTVFTSAFPQSKLSVHALSLYELSLYLGPDLSLVHECDLCHKFFSTDALRVAHMNKEHKERLKCKICAKEFFTRNSLFSHIRYHHKDRKRQKTMARHNENGSDSKNSLEIKKNFSCSLCERTYKSHITLTRHLVKHGSFKHGF